jgi:Uma2 family endonuclease
MMDYKMPEEDQEKNKVEEPDLAGYYTASDYLKWTFDGFVELIRGKIFKMSSPASAHQAVAMNLGGDLHKRFKKSSCKVFIAPYDIYFVKEGEDYKRGRNIVQPDICIICDRNKIKSFGCVGAPDLIIEILSPSTARKDADYKFTLYEEYGVKEYWIVHPVEGTVTMNVLENGAYRTLKPKAKGEILHSVLFPDLAVDLETVFDDIEFDD